MTDIDRKWDSPGSFVITGRWNRQMRVAIHQGEDSAFRYCAIPKNAMFFSIITSNGRELHVLLTRDEVRELVDAINELGDRMVGLE